MEFLKLTQNQIKYIVYFNHVISSKYQEKSILVEQTHLTYHVGEKGKIWKCNISGKMVISQIPVNICQSQFSYVLHCDIYDIALGLQGDQTSPS